MLYVQWTLLLIIANIITVNNKNNETTTIIRIVVVVVGENRSINNIQKINNNICKTKHYSNTINSNLSNNLHSEHNSTTLWSLIIMIIRDYNDDIVITILLLLFVVWPRFYCFWFSILRILNHTQNKLKNNCNPKQPQKIDTVIRIMSVQPSFPASSPLLDTLCSPVY